MDTATSRSMTVLVGQGRLCPPAPFSRHSRSTRRTQTPSFPEVPNAEPKNFVIPRAVAESIFACQRISQRSQCPLHSTCDFAQYDGVGRARASLSSGTLLPSFPKYPPNPNAVIPAEPKRRHSRSTRRTQTSSFRAQSRNPSLLANASAREASALCTPVWILRLRAV